MGRTWRSAPPAESPRSAKEILRTSKSRRPARASSNSPARISTPAVLPQSRRLTWQSKIVPETPARPSRKSIARTFQTSSPPAANAPACSYTTSTKVIPSPPAQLPAKLSFRPKPKPARIPAIQSAETCARRQIHNCPWILCAPRAPVPPGTREKAPAEFSRLPSAMIQVVSSSASELQTARFCPEPPCNTIEIVVGAGLRPARLQSRKSEPPRANLFPPLIHLQLLAKRHRDR